MFVPLIFLLSTSVRPVICNGGKPNISYYEPNITIVRGKEARMVYKVSYVDSHSCRMRETLEISHQHMCLMYLIQALVRLQVLEYLTETNDSPHTNDHFSPPKYHPQAPLNTYPILQNALTPS